MRRAAKRNIVEPVTVAQVPSKEEEKCTHVKRNAEERREEQ
jgi:hypothetical protein